MSKNSTTWIKQINYLKDTSTKFHPKRKIYTYVPGIIKVIKFVVKTLTIKKSSGLDDFIGELYQILNAILCNVL